MSTLNLNEFAHVIPEWLLNEALNNSQSDFINKFDKITIRIPSRNKEGKLSEIINLASNSKILYEKPLIKSDKDKWGIQFEDSYLKNYWFLRPDFMLIDDTNIDKQLIIFEAKVVKVFLMLCGLSQKKKYITNCLMKGVIIKVV
jgi:hypothetical protein